MNSLKTVVMALSSKFNFDYETAMNFLKNPPEKIRKSLISNSKQTPATTPQILKDIVMLSFEDKKLIWMTLHYLDSTGIRQ